MHSGWFMFNGLLCFLMEATLVVWSGRSSPTGRNQRTLQAITRDHFFEDIPKTASNISWLYLVELVNLERKCSDAF